MKVYNTLTKKVEDFSPTHNKKIVMYVCGLTPYDHTHLGHARTYVSFDVIKRYLLYKGYNVLHIQNITDVEDKIINRAKETNKSPLELSKHFHSEALSLFDSLNILRADFYPAVSEHIPEIIEIIKKIIRNGYAYETETGVYFNVAKFKKYGKLSGQKIKEIEKEHRIEPDPTKKNPVDFALWKKTKKGEEPIGFDSPWGYGRPGWHIECSAMSMKYTENRTIDIHGGAKDLIFPHHENEIAQSEAAFKVQFVKYWLHTGFLTVNGVKMSKSLGNFITLKDALSKHSPQAIRLLFVMTKYSSPIDYSEKHVESASAALRRIEEGFVLLSEAEKSKKPNRPDPEFRRKMYELKNMFFEAMDNDFDTAKAVASFFDFISEVNRHIAGKEMDYSALKIAKQFYNDVFFILGIEIEEKGSEGAEEPLLNAVLSIREELRKAKQFELSDRIRKILNESGYEILDTPEGPKVRKKF
ncbi:MAG: cysteine--tRNA ligase [Candidatus Anstonellales archaeon]